MRAAALSVATCTSSVRSRADAGVMRDAGSYTPKCATTVRREVLDERGEPIAVARIDAAELGAPQAAARRHEVDADDLAGPVALLDQLRDARAELAAHAGDEHARSFTTSPPPVAGAGTG